MTDLALYPDRPAAKPLWLVTLADLALLLVGFFVLIQATERPRAVTDALRASFGGGAIRGATANPPAPLPVMAAGQAVLVDGDHALDDQMWLDPTPGHSPGHVCMNLSAGGRDAVSSGDLLHHAVQVAHPEWNSRFCWNDEMSRATRRKFVHDRAPAYQSAVADANKSGDFYGFDDIELAAGKAPDMSQLDAGVCPHMERVVEASGAHTLDEIRAAVAAGWKEITPDVCERISMRVRRNMLKVIELKGGNFYDE